MTSKLSPQAMLFGLVEHYSAQTEYNPLLSQTFSTNDLRNVFWTSLDHDIQLISQRSQDLDDHEINLMQKALNTLHSEGNLVSAANLYVELILGAPSVSTTVLSGRILVVHHLAVAYEICQKECTSGPPRIKTSEQTNRVADVLKTLLRVYKDAKEDFYAVTPKSGDATRAARFLRDTAENLVHYVRPPQPRNESACLPPVDDSRHNKKLYDELLETLAWTSKFVECASGGKKRVWEQPKEQLDRNKVLTRKKRIRRSKGNRHHIYPARTLTDYFDNVSASLLPHHDCIVPRYESSHRCDRNTQDTPSHQIRHNNGQRCSLASESADHRRSTVMGLSDNYRPNYR